MEEKIDKRKDCQKQLNNWEETSPSFERNIPPHKIFELYLTDEEMEGICLESTNYVRLKGEHNFTMTLDKLKAFIAILLVSKYTKLSRHEIYWERKEDGHNLFVSLMMSKTEFEECKKYLNLSDNSDLDMADRFAKVRPLFNSINQQCLLNYQPTQHLSVDESYFGAKQYIHGKPIKHGYKLWVMATQLGYCIQFCPYAGKGTILQEYTDIDLGLGASVVAHLVNTLPNAGDLNYHIVMDNFFASPELLRHSSSKKIAATRAVRVNQMENASLQDLGKTAKDSPGTMYVITDVSSNVTAVRWKGSKIVNTLSTFTGKEPHGPKLTAWTKIHDQLTIKEVLVAPF